MTLYRLYLRSRVRREMLASPRNIDVGPVPAAPDEPGREERTAVVYGDQRYSYAISGREEIEAEDDAAALAIARGIFEAATDVCDAFELWDGARHVDQSRVATLPSLTAQRQEHVVRLEEALLTSGWAIARSRRLLARFNELRERANADDPLSPAKTQY